VFVLAKFFQASLIFVGETRVEIHIMDHLHWQYLTRYGVRYPRHYRALLLTLANRNDPICVELPKVAKASIIRVAVAGVIVGVFTLTFANGNTA
jgi:hypothetical protein